MMMGDVEVAGNAYIAESNSFTVTSHLAPQKADAREGSAPAPKPVRSLDLVVDPGSAIVAPGLSLPVAF
jgi:hypothetical protein